MNLDTSTIDRIVAGVLTQLGTVGEGARADVTTETSSHAEGSPDLTISDAVVTADVLLKSVKGDSQVIVAKNAIVTPAARDVAREKGIEIIYQSSPATLRASKTKNAHEHNSVDKTHGTLPLGLAPLLIVVRNTKAVERLWDDLQSTWRREVLGCPDDAASLAVSAICRAESSTVVILAEQTHRSACLANRNERVKAVAVVDAGDVRTVRSQLNANVWCIDPTACSWFELRNILRAIS